MNLNESHMIEFMVCSLDSYGNTVGHFEVTAPPGSDVEALAEARCNLAGEDPNNEEVWRGAVAEAREELGL